MRRVIATLLLAASPVLHYAQTNPAITSWLINTTGAKGRHYVQGNPAPIADTMLANVMLVRYSEAYSYVNCNGIPSYVIGPYPDGNPATAVGRNYLFKIPLDPQPNTGTKTAVGLGHIAVLVNGVPVYNYADARSYNNQNVWHQNAVFFERIGFDCSKGHPAPLRTGPPGMGGGSADGQYHHHQDPSAFNVAKVVMSDICDMYLADGLYVPDSTQHGPLIGFAFDGYPIYAAYGWADGTQSVRRITSSYQIRSIVERTTLPDGTVLSTSQYGPALSQYPLGAYAEDYEYLAGSGDLDEHNGRFCITPEYPSGTYAYFATIDEDGNSVYPYVIGPTYYGVVEQSNFAGTGPGAAPTRVTITEPVTRYLPGVTSVRDVENAITPTVFPNPAMDVIIVQVRQPLQADATVSMYDLRGVLVRSSRIHSGSTMCYVDVETLYAGTYIVHVETHGVVRSYPVILGE